MELDVLPTLHLQQGSEVIVNVTNDGDLDATVHWHGLRLENKYDGVPHETQQPIPIGGSFTYRIQFPDLGLYWYHPHIREDYTQEMGLYGNIIVEPTEPGYWPAANRDIVLTLDDVLLEDGRAEQFRSLLVVFPRSRRSRSQYPFDEVVDEGGGGGFALERHAHEHTAGQHRERGIDVLRVEVRVEDVPHRASARLVEPESQLTDDLTLVGTLHDTGEQTIQMALREIVGEVSEGRAQIAAQVPRGRWVLRFVAYLLDGFPDEVEASRPVRIDRGLGETGPPGDLSVGNGIPADLDEQRGGGCDDVAPRPGHARIQRSVEICHE